MEEHGIIVENKDGRAVVKTQKGTSCEGCASKRSCQSIGETDMLIEVDNSIGAKVGEQVVFTVGAGSVMKAGVLFYLVPVLAFIIGVVIGQTVLTGVFPNQNPDMLSGVFGAALLIVSFIALRIYSKRLERDGSYRAHIMRVV